MQHSTGTDPLTLTPDDRQAAILRYRARRDAEAKAQQAARGPTGVGGVMARSVPLGIGDLLHAFGTAAGGNPMQAGMDAGIDVGMGSLGLQRPGIQKDASGLANQFAAPPEAGSGMQTLESILRGAIAGAPAGPAGVAGGVGGGLGQDIAQRFGAGPAGQAVGALAGGAAGAGTASFAGSRLGTANKAAAAVGEEVGRGGDRPQTRVQEARQRAVTDAGSAGFELLGPEGEVMAQQIASERGAAGASFVQKALKRYQTARRDFVTRVTNRLGRRGDAQLDQEITVARRRATDPLYKDLRQKSVEVTPDLVELLDHPDVERAVTRSANDYNLGKPSDQQIPNSLRLTAAEAAAEGIEVAPGDKLPFRTELPFASLDELKKGFDAVNADIVDPTQRTAAQANATAFVRQVREAVTKQLPEYGVALKIGKQFFDQGDAVQLGRELLDGKTSDDVVSVRMDRMQAVEQEANQGGVALDLKAHVKFGLADRIAKGELPPDFLSDPQSRARLSRVLSSTEMAALDDAFSTAVSRQGAAARIVGASEPKRGEVAVSKLQRAATEVALGLMRSAARDIANSQTTRIKFKPPVRAELADVLSAQGPEFVAKADDIIRRLNIQQSALPRGIAGAGAAAASGARRE